MDDTSTCPTLRDDDDEVARQWASGSLAPDAESEFEDHLRTCSRCQKAVERAAEVTAALRAAAASHQVAASPMRRLASAVATQARALADNFRQARSR
jgi:anti-sigma factor RsiW